MLRNTGCRRLSDTATRLSRDTRYRGALFRRALPALTQNLRLAVVNGTLTLDPPVIREIRGRDGVKTIAQYGLQETLLLTALHRLLADGMDLKLSPECIGGRRGFSRHSFLGTLARARREKRNWVLVTDVAGYYASVDQDILDEVLRAKPFRLARDIRGLVMRLVRAGGRGLLPGNALAKHLANAYLHESDEFLASKGLVFCRFIDDFAVFVKTRRQAEAILEELRTCLQTRRGLALSAPKTGIYHRYQQGFEFLGYRVIGDSTLPTHENAERFVAQVQTYAERARVRSLSKAVRGLNRRIHWFGHQYKQGRVKQLYDELDEKVRAALRAHLKNRADPAPANARFRAPKGFPGNPAFANADLAALGLASLAKIKADYDLKSRAERPPSVRESGPPEIVEVSREGTGLLRILLRAGKSEPQRSR